MVYILKVIFTIKKYAKENLKVSLILAFKVYKYINKYIHRYAHISILIIVALSYPTNSNIHNFTIDIIHSFFFL